MDEAPHARELTTLIPIAFFSPLAWIFTGDVKQTRPFVKSPGRRDAEIPGHKFNPFAEQLSISTMARAEAANAINARLLINKRGYANLHLLPSKMFYDGQMISGHVERYPASATHLRQHLEKLGGIDSLEENRVVIRLNDSQEQRIRNSFWNPSHHHWVLGEAEKLLRDEAFKDMAGAPGTLMIAAPYSAAVRQYKASTKKWPSEWQDRVEFLTVDKAQGNQADVVLLDLVRTTTAGFMDDPQRLNVAITRARQAEIIVMHHRMAMRCIRGATIKTRYLSQIWDDAVQSRRIFSL